jgi:single-strand DNA-binding protein
MMETHTQKGNTMAGEAIISVTGNVGADPEVRFLPSGKAVCSFSLANTPARYNKEDNAWVDQETVWFRIAQFDKRGEATAEAVRKGDRVAVHGKLTQSTYTKKDGSQGSSLEINADSVGIVPRASKAVAKDEADPWT